MVNTVLLSVTLLLFSTLAQCQKIEVLTLGTFHFNFPNLDVRKTPAADQIDVLQPQYQKELEDIVKRVAQFRPTIIAIEREPSKQALYDSLYDKYLQGKYELRRNEEEQIGFRLAKLLGLKKLYCIDSDARYYVDINTVLEAKDSVENKKFMKYFYEHPDTGKQFFPKALFKTDGILAELRRVNDDDNVKKSLGNYLIGVFKYETKDNEFFGPDFVAGWWFNRNLRIFRNLQKISTNPTDRILIIFGHGHLNILNILLQCSPEYELVRTNDYLK